LTISCIARPKRKAPKARTTLAGFAEEHARREVELERAAETLRAERDRAIRDAYKDGLTMADIAAVMAMSHQRVSQIVRS
jgi:DNA-directed RNA polymerase specialized sigma subunit